MEKNKEGMGLLTGEDGVRLTRVNGNSLLL
jgi:hypothetical protein